MSSPATVGRPTYDVDFADPTTNRDPYPHLAAMRDLAPVVYNPQTNWWMATSWENVRYVLGGEETFGQEVELFEYLFGAIVFEAMDQPRHDEVRAIWKPYFLRAFVDQYEAAVHQVVDELLAPLVERLRDGETVEAFSDLVAAVPAHVVAVLVGAPRGDYPLFRRWNEDITGVLVARTNDNSDEANALRARAAEANTAMREYFAAAMDARRASGSTEDLVGVIAHSPVELSEEQRRAHLVQLMWAGSDSTAKLLSNTMVTLAQYPDQRRVVAADRSLVPQAIEESLRYQTVSFALSRIPRHDVLIGDVTVPAGEKVVGMTAGANRDPARWDEADRYDVLRAPKAHVGFGTGIHSCLGVHVARLEARIWLNRLLDEIPEYELTVPNDEIEYGSNIMTRGPVSIPIAI